MHFATSFETPQISTKMDRIDLSSVRVILLSAFDNQESIAACRHTF